LHVDALPNALGDDAEILENLEASFHAFSVFLVHGVSVYIDIDVFDPPSACLTSSEGCVNPG
jgi:hypothetical protein